MSKKTDINMNNMKDDDMEGLLDDLEGDSDMEGLSIEDNRHPDTNIALKTRIGSGINNSLTDARVIKNSIVTKVLPDKLQAPVEDVLEVKDSITEIYEDTVEELKPKITSFVKNVDRVLPKEGTLRKILDKTKKSLGIDNEDEIRRNKEDSEEQKGRSFSDEIIPMMMQKTDIQSRIDAAIAQKSSLDQQRLLSEISVNSTSLLDFNTGVAANYYRKSLELQYRHLFVSKESLEFSKSYFHTTKVQLDTVAKNTGLPDFVKLRSFEVLKEQFRAQQVGKVHDKLLGEGTFISRLIEGAKTKVEDTTGGFSDILEQLSNAAEQSADAKEMGMDMDAGEMTGGQLGEAGVNTIASWIGKLLAKSDTIKDFVSNVDGKYTDLPGFFSDLEHGDHSTIVKVLAGVVNSTVKKRKKDLVIETEGYSGVDVPAFFDLRTRDSIVSVIPGILSRIHGEVRSLRTGEDPGILRYDFSKRTFIDSAARKKGGPDTAIDKDIQEKFAKIGKDTSYKKTSNMLMDEVMKSNKGVSTKHKELMQDRLIKQSISKKEGGIEHFEKEKFYEGLNETDTAALKKMFDNVTKGTKDSKEGDNIAAFNRRYNKTGDTAVDPKALIKNLMDTGYTEDLVSMGMLKIDKKGNYIVDDKMTSRLMLGKGSKLANSMATSNAKNNPFTDNKNKTTVDTSASPIADKAKNHRDSDVTDMLKSAKKIGSNYASAGKDILSAASGKVSSRVTDGLSSNIAPYTTKKEAKNYVKELLSLVKDTALKKLFKRHLTSLLRNGNKDGYKSIIAIYKTTYVKDALKKYLEENILSGRSNLVKDINMDMSLLDKSKRFSKDMLEDVSREKLTKTARSKVLNAKEKITRKTKTFLRDNKDTINEAKTITGNYKEFGKGILNKAGKRLSPNDESISAARKVGSNYTEFGKDLMNKGIGSHITREQAKEYIAELLSTIKDAKVKKIVKRHLNLLLRRGNKDGYRSIISLYRMLDTKGVFKKYIDANLLSNRSNTGKNYGAYISNKDRISKVKDNAKDKTFSILDDITSKSKNLYSKKDEFISKGKEKIKDFSHNEGYTHKILEGLDRIINHRFKKDNEKKPHHQDTSTGVDESYTPNGKIDEIVTNIKRLVDLSSTNVDYLDAILVAIGAMGGAEPSSFEGFRKGAAGKLRKGGNFLKNAALYPFKAVGGFLKKTFSFLASPFKKMFSMVSGIKDKFSWVGDIAGNLKKRVSGMFSTIFSGLGKIAKPITSLITGGVGLMKDVAGGMKDIIGKSLGFAKDKLGSVLGFSKNLVVSGVKKSAVLLFGNRQRPIDLYIPGKPDPVILAVKMENGFYIDKDSGKVIKKLNDINGTVIDRDGQVVVTADDISKGLVNVKGKNIPLGKKVKKGMLFTAKDRIVSGYKKAGSMAKSLLSKFKKGEGSSPEVDIGDKVGTGNEWLIKIHGLVKSIDGKLTKQKKKFNDADGDGFRTGSWRDKLKGSLFRKKKDKNGKTVKEKSEGFGLKDIMGIVTSAVGIGTNILGAVTSGLGFIGTVIAGIATLFGLKKFLPKMPWSKGKANKFPTKEELKASKMKDKMSKDKSKKTKFKDKLKNAGKTVKDKAGKVVTAAKKIDPKKAFKKISTKIFTKGAIKTLVKKIPLLGLLAGTGYAVSRLFDGEFGLAGLEFLSGLASTVPGMGTAASFGIDATIMTADALKDPKEVKDNVDNILDFDSKAKPSNRSSRKHRRDSKKKTTADIINFPKDYEEEDKPVTNIAARMNPRMIGKPSPKDTMIIEALPSMTSSLLSIDQTLKDSLVVHEKILLAIDDLNIVSQESLDVQSKKIEPSKNKPTSRKSRRDRVIPSPKISMARTKY